MALLSRESILQLDDKRTKTVAVKEWGGEVIIRTMTAAEKGAFEQKMMAKKFDYTTIKAEYVATICVDEDGKNLFTAADVKALSEKSDAALTRIFEAGNDLNSFSDEDIEELAKN